MTIDVVIGNPPYNNDIYIDFVTVGMSLSSVYCVMITPAKWQAKGDIKNAQFRDNVEPYIKELVYYPDCLDVFAIQEPSGICYYLIGRTEQSDIKIINISAMKPCINSIEIRSIKNGESLWNCGNSVVKKIKQSSDYKPYIFSEELIKKKYTINFNKQLNVAVGSSGCYDWDNGCIKSDWVGKGGVIFTSDGVNVLSNPKLITEAQDNSSGTSINVFTTDNIDEGKSFLYWTSLKFIRFLLLINIGSLIIMNQYGWRFVPDPGSFDHVFTDDELYQKYNLSPDEIEIIESVIKERDKNKTDIFNL